MHPERAGWNHGDGYVFTDFTQDVYLNDALSERTTRYTYTIYTVRDRVEFYKFGTMTPESDRRGPVRCLSEGRTQQFVASTSMDTRNPNAGAWHIIRFNPKLPFRATPTVVIEEGTRVSDPADRVRQAGLSIAGLDPVMKQLGLQPKALLRVHVSREIAPEYSRDIYSPVGKIMDRPLSSELVVRDDDSPMIFEPAIVLPNARYVIDWTAPPTPR